MDDVESRFGNAQTEGGRNVFLFSVGRCANNAQCIPFLSSFSFFSLSLSSTHYTENAHIFADFVVSIFHYFNRRNTLLFELFFLYVTWLVAGYTTMSPVQPNNNKNEEKI